jgi:hypothetical protein
MPDEDEDGEDAPPKRPDVPAPMEWFEGGLWAKLDGPLVVWLARVLLLVPGSVGAIAMIQQTAEEGYISLGLVYGSALVCVVVAFAVAFEMLREAVRQPTGLLVVMARGAAAHSDDGRPLIPVKAYDSLVHWRKWVTLAVVLWMCFCMVLVGVMLYHLYEWEAARKLSVGVCVGAIVAGPTFAWWYLTLRLACALVAIGAVASTGESVGAPGGAGATMSTVEWENGAVKDLWCNAVYNATGLIYQPAVQACLFDDSWPGGQGRRRLGTGECEAPVTGDDLRTLKEELREELIDKAAHAQEFMK